jgi:hypothetical protein
MGPSSFEYRLPRAPLGAVKPKSRRRDRSLDGDTAKAVNRAPLSTKETNDERGQPRPLTRRALGQMLLAMPIARLAAGDEKEASPRARCLAATEPGLSSD